MEEVEKDRVTKGISRSNFLSKFFMVILSDLSVDVSMMERQISRYVEQKIKPDNISQLTQIRSQIKKELFSTNTMTMKVFLKALRILGGVKINFIVEIERASGIKTKHGIGVYIDQDDSNEE